MKVYTAFNFFNELDMLELRLEVMNSAVDYFVICESTKTHSGKPKPLYYQENKRRYSKFKNKIIHYVIKDTPQTYNDLENLEPEDSIHNSVINNVKNMEWVPKNEMHFVRDGYEKECQKRGIALGHPKGDDIMVVGDLDEIPRPGMLKGLVEIFDNERIYLLENMSCSFYANLEKAGETWMGASVLTFEKLLQNSIPSLRMFKTGNHVINGGWHFTYMGGAEEIVKKLEAFSHQEFNTEYIKANVPYLLANCVQNGIDILGRPSQWIVHDINDGTLPEYLVNNKDKFKKYIYYAN
jgi:beta-1,4-mannosyl-glycoprotein beta-1,4-N-acetylglucosaminyltransferase